MEDLADELSREEWYAQALSSPIFTIIVLGLASLGYIFKKNLEELTSVSYVLLTVIGLFISLLLLELNRDEGQLTEDMSTMMAVKFDHKLLTAVSILLFAYTFQFMVFPAYVELDRRSNERFEKATILSLVIYTVALILTGLSSVFIFGGTLKPDLLDSFATRSGSLSIMVRFIYCAILGFHLPYIFFALKEYALVMYEEIQSQTMSQHIEAKLRFDRIVEEEEDKEEEEEALIPTTKDEGENENARSAIEETKSLA